MEMQVRHALAGVGTAVDDDPIPAGQFARRPASDDHQQMSGQNRVAFAQIAERKNFLLGDDQDVNRAGD